jgi:catechol 2,3-dioxygenase-like lactoylglutathione lyase family enzyme
MKFNNVRLLVSDFDKCFTFYKDTLSLECTWGELGDNFASFNIGYNSVLSLFTSNLMATAINNQDAEKNETIIDKFALIIEVENVDDSFKSLQNKGIEFLTEPKDMSAWGIRVTHFRDPENNLIELFQDLPKDKWDKE